METLVMAAQLILGLSILVGLHELGHLLAAKYFGMRVEQFSIGFPPKIFGVKYGETEYSIGAIPLGGFVKITGMVDESLDTAHLNEEPQPYEFRAKPAWQRLIVMMGGIIVNVILGIIVFIALTFSYGDNYIPMDEVNKYGIVAYELGEELGFRTGDRIVAVNGFEVEKFEDVISNEVMMGDNSYYTVDRNGEKIEIQVPPGFIEKLSNKEAAGKFIEPAVPFEVGEVRKGSGADKGGLLQGDKILSVDGQEISFFHQLKPILEEHKGETVTVVVNRKESDTENHPGGDATLSIPINEDGEMGFYPEPLIASEKIDYSFGESITEGTATAFELTILNIKGIGKVFSGDVSTKSLKGPMGIAQIFGGTWDWYRFWFLTGMLSMWLAFLNFLPIPALDGGHVAFLSYEIISGRKPSDKFLETAQKIGMVILLALMVFVIFNDVFNTFFA